MVSVFTVMLVGVTLVLVTKLIRPEIKMLVKMSWLFGTALVFIWIHLTLIVSLSSPK